MTVDIARMDSNAVAVLGGANDALARLADWVAAADNAHSLVSRLIGTPFIPATFWPKLPDNPTEKQSAEAKAYAAAGATAAVLQGITLGLDPLTALAQIYVVNGRPGLYAKVMVALVQAHGHEVWTRELTDTRAVVCGRRKGSEHQEEVVITMDMARKAKWTRNSKYEETPRDMLWSRAAARVCDRIASDVLKGIASVEEIQDTIQATAEVGSNGHRTVTPRKRVTPAIESVVEEPPLEDEPAAAEPEPAAPAAQEPAATAGITPAQQKLLHALLRDKGKADRDIALVYIAGIIGRELETTKDLGKDEATAVIDALRQLAVHVEEPTLDEDWPQVAGEAQ